ncbi:tyrosinase family protein [Methylocystis sp. WRRC1]|uniref:tyrosinase family protein n=1 Tax=Methylocystis sp. WRRC1 TaxID=1732014 RepID=UPI001D157907|nr:tyrosinase family protein [Methylocystis sp. WRRC1]
MDALRKVKADGVVDDFAETHATHFGHGIHRSSHFLPWHREFLLRFEIELQKHDSNVALPYWDSTTDVSPDDPLWGPDFLGPFDVGWGLGRELGSDTLPTAGEVATTLNLPSYDRFWPKLERDIHNPPHRWVGGVMASAASPGDPIFFLHHSWIDLQWVKWRHDHSNEPFIASGPGLGLNDPLMSWPDRTPADVLDHIALGYQYDVEALVA